MCTPPSRPRRAPRGNALGSYTASGTGKEWHKGGCGRCCLLRTADGCCGGGKKRAGHGRAAPASGRAAGGALTPSVLTRACAGRRGACGAPGKGDEVQRLGWMHMVHGVACGPPALLHSSARLAAFAESSLQQSCTRTTDRLPTTTHLLLGLGERRGLDLRDFALVRVAQAQLDEVVLLHALRGCKVARATAAASRRVQAGAYGSNRHCWHLCKAAARAVLTAPATPAHSSQHPAGLRRAAGQRLPRSARGRCGAGGSSHIRRRHASPAPPAPPSG